MIEQVSDKSLIKKRFNKSISTYNANAIIQTKMAQKLVRHLDALSLKNLGNVLELGCGTGLVTQELFQSYEVSFYTANDIVPDYETNIRHLAKHFGVVANFIDGDFEEQGLFTEMYDTIVAGACLQWSSDIKATLTMLSEKLNKEGILAFSSFGKENVSEISSIIQAGLPYYSLSELKTICSDKFEVLHASEVKSILYFTSPLEILHHMKRTGVNAIGSDIWTPSRLRGFEQQYSERFHTSRGYRLTYHPMYFILKKKQ